MSTTAICFSEWLQRLPPFIVDFRCCLCDRVDFWPAVFYRFVQLVILNGGQFGISWRLIGYWRLCRKIVSLYQFIWKLYHNNQGVPVIMRHRVELFYICITYLWNNSRVIIIFVLVPFLEVGNHARKRNALFDHRKSNIAVDINRIPLGRVKWRAVKLLVFCGRQS